MKKQFKILDFFTHQGAQYELYKTGHKFYVVGVNSMVPNWDIKDRPLLPNVSLITEQEALRRNYDIVIVRSPVNTKRYEPFIKRGAKPVAAVQTTSPYPLPKSVRHVVWNCATAKDKYHKAHYKDKKGHYVVHGFDPEEFVSLDLERSPRVLTVANVLKPRAQIMGYDWWDEVQKELGICDLVGHGNEDIDPNNKKAADFADLVRIYNSYQVFFNPTRESANPRSRGEAAMCGSAIVSTSKFDARMYYSHNKNILFADNPTDMIREIKRLLNEKNLREDLGSKAREVAIKHFHIKDFVEKWNRIFEAL